MLARDKNKSTIIEFDKPKLDNHIQFEEYNIKSTNSEKFEKNEKIEINQKIEKIEINQKFDKNEKIEEIESCESEEE